MLGIGSLLDGKKKKAKTPEKREAISRIARVLQEYKRHQGPAEECADLILATDRNVPVIEKIAEYSIIYINLNIQTFHCKKEV